MTIGDIFMIGFLIMIAYMALNGWLILICGYGLKERMKCWSSEQYLKRTWAENKDRRYREYFS